MLQFANEKASYAGEKVYQFGQNVYQTTKEVIVPQVLPVASTVVSLVGPQLSRNSLLDVNDGLILGVNGSSQSLYSMNNGLSCFVNNNVSTVSGTNTGFIGGGNVSVNAVDSYASVGIVAGINANMSANDLNLNTYVTAAHNLNLNVRNKATIDADVSGRNIYINAKEVELKKENVLNAREGTARIIADTITNESAIKGNVVCMQAKVISLQDGSDIHSQGGDNAVAIKAEEYLEAKAGSIINGGDIKIDAKSFKGNAGNIITSTNQTIIKTAHLENQGSIKGALTLDFTGDSSQLKGIGTVDNIQYYGTLENGLADTFAAGKSDLVNVTPSGSVTLFAGDQDVHLKDEHTMNHGLKIESSGVVKCDKKLTSSKFVDLKAQGNLEHKSIAAGGKVSLGGKNIIATSNVTRTGDGINYEDHVEDITITGSGIEAHATEHLIYEAVKTHSGKDGTALTAAGKNISAAVLAEQHVENQTVNNKTQETETTKYTLSKAHVCTHTSEGIVTMAAGDTLELEGATIDSRGGKPVLKGKNGVNASAVDQISTYESEYIKKGGWFRSDKHNHIKIGSSTAKTVDFISDEAPEISSDVKISMNFTSNSSHITLNAPSVEIHLAKNKILSYSKNDWSNVVWESEREQFKEDITHSPSFAGIIETNAEKIYCEEVKGHAAPIYKTNHNDAVFTRNVLEEKHEHQKHSLQRPTRATACVVAMAVTMLTSGIGSSAGATMATTLGCKTAVSTAFVTNATAAALTSLSTQAADILLKCNGDVSEAAKTFASTDTLKKFVLDTVTAGTMGGAGQALNKMGLPAVQEGHNLGERLLYAAPRQIVNGTIKTVAHVIAGQDCKEAAKQNVRSALAGTIGTACTSQIGDAYGKEQIDPVSHKLLHTGVGVVEGAIIGGLNGAIAGGMGALVTETVADVLAPEVPSFECIRALEAQMGRPLTQEEFTQVWNDQMSTYWEGVSSTADISRFAAASVVLLSRQDVDIANTVSSTAIDNNFLILAGYGLVAAGAGYSAYRINNAYKEGGPEAALKQLGIEVGTYIIGAGVVKVCFKYGPIVYPSAKLAVAAALEATPGLKLFLGELTEGLVVTGEKIGQSMIGKGAAKLANGASNLAQNIGIPTFGKGVSVVENHLVNTTNKITQTLGNVGENFAENLVEHVVPNSVISKLEARAAKEVVEKVETTIAQNLGNLFKPDHMMTTPEGIKISVPDTSEAVLFQKSDNIGELVNKEVKSVASSIESPLGSQATKSAAKVKDAAKAENKTVVSPAPSINAENSGIIKNDLRTTITRYQNHIFSDEHKRDGILALGKNEEVIMDSLRDKIMSLDKKGLLQEGSNQMRVMINKIDSVEIRCHIKNGEVISVNAFISDFGRIFNNFIDTTKVLK